eukprot:5112978-Prymnesium_polylepis.2
MQRRSRAPSTIGCATRSRRTARFLSRGRAHASRTALMPTRCRSRRRPTGRRRRRRRAAAMTPPPT